MVECADPVRSIRQLYRAAYGRDARIFSAPGRVNLIGEHTDYNDGFVLPFAIERRAFVAAHRRRDRKVRVSSANMKGHGEFDLDRAVQTRRGNWLDYVEGTARVLDRPDDELTGADLLIDSHIPIGAGLSSSAALELSVGLALASLSGRKVAPLHLALAAQRAEHEYVGTQSGIMDQYIAALGQSGHALLVDCRSLESRSVPLTLDDHAILVCDTGVKHELASSAYNRRRSECQEGIRLIRGKLPHVRALRDVSTAEFSDVAKVLPEPIRRRCRHVITENERTLAAERRLQLSDFVALGRLMAESHHSLKYDYEVSSNELDLCVEVALAAKGVCGARMTGGGFGGSTITLVERQAIAAVSDSLAREFDSKYGRRPDLFVTRATEGAREHE
jgi:galactokinase